MSLALSLAKQGALTVSPNPQVGCVIVNEGRIVGQGFHQYAGEPHAEIHALQKAGEKAQGATVYVHLEPCCHYGKTPPCTSALIHAGIKKIYIACSDPNPLVSGQGIAALRAANIEVELGLCEAQAQALNEVFFHFMQHRRPFVILKWAMSVDGKTVTHPKDIRQISSEEAQRHLHQLRHSVDAILIGAHTARLDNPLLTVRKENFVGKQPLRVILSTQGDLPLDLKLFDPKLPGKTMLMTTENVKSFPAHVEVITFKKDKIGKIKLQDVLNVLGERQITSVLVEGGMQVHQQFFQERLINQICFYLSPVAIFSFEHKIKLKNFSFLETGSDLFIETRLS